MVGTLPQYTLESSIANNFGVGFEHGPQTTTIFTQIVFKTFGLLAGKDDLGR